MRIFSTTIIPTVGRPTLDRAVSSVLNQGFSRAGFEVIVVNDSGRELPAYDWLRSPQVRLVTTDRQERCVARNKGASVARGDYLHFLDDDDIALEGALEAFWRLRDAHPAATWLYGGYATTDNAGVQVAEFRPDLGEAPLVPLVAGEFIPLQSSLLSVKAFHDAKGFDPAFVGVEDRDLERRLAPTVLAVSMPTLVAQIRIGEEGSTTNWGTIVIDDQRSREAMLNSEIVRAQLRQVTSPAYWRGRIARAYFGSAALNARQGRPIVAASRIWHGSRLSGSYLASSSFWRGIRLVR